MKNRACGSSADEAVDRSFSCTYNAPASRSKSAHAKSSELVRHRQWQSQKQASRDKIGSIEPIRPCILESASAWCVRRFSQLAENRIDDGVRLVELNIVGATPHEDLLRIL